MFKKKHIAKKKAKVKVKVMFSAVPLETVVKWRTQYEILQPSEHTPKVNKKAYY